MNKLIAGTLAASVILTACGGTTEQHDHKETKQSEQPNTKQAHQVEKKNGVTTVDGLMIVNKKVPISKHYNQGENQTARQHLNEMMQAAHQQGLHIVYRSGFRSYQEQVGLYNSYVKRDGQKAADKYSARPGYSEHQTGLAFDVGTPPGNKDFLEAYGETPEGKWLAQHAHEYGFILRYPKGKEHVTGYQYEPWHFRYVGQKHARAIHAQHTTLEEYLDYGYDKK
ncbi:M15 family metallopeptidase [Staphylococcus simulans]